MPVNLDDINLRPASAADEAFLLAVYESTRTEELDAAGFPTDVRAPFLKMQFNARQQAYHGTFPRGEFLIIESDGQAVGDLIVNRAADELRLVDIALLPAHRGRGIGTKLIQRLLAESAAANLPLRLSVVRGQRASRLYRRLGFAKTGESDWRDLMEWRAPQPPH